jgi:hypothetical protein
MRVLRRAAVGRERIGSEDISTFHDDVLYFCRVKGSTPFPSN